MLSTPPSQMQVGAISENPSTWLTSSPGLGDSLRSRPTQLQVHPSHFPWLFHTNDVSWLMLHSFQKSLKGSQTSSSWPQHAASILLNSPQPGTSSSQPRFLSWPLPGITEPNMDGRHPQITLWFMQSGLKHGTGRGLIWPVVGQTSSMASFMP